MPRPKFFDCYDCGGITGDHYGFGPFVDQEIAQSQSSIPNFRKLFGILLRLTPVYIWGRLVHIEQRT